MKSYLGIKEDEKAIYVAFYDKRIRLWIVYETNDYGEQVSREADYYQNKKQMMEAHSFDKFIVEPVDFFLERDEDDEVDEFTRMLNEEPYGVGELGTIKADATFKKFGEIS